MERMKMHSVDGVARNVETIGALFPNAVTEVMRDGQVVQAIDFDVLRQELAREIVEGREERYAFTWPDKRQAILAANAPINATLRPVVEDSVGRDSTEGAFDSENLYIEGDNLDVLKLLQETYLGKVKMIYIDPPYNTGNDSFVYDDDFAMEDGAFVAANVPYDEHGNMVYDFKKNLDSNGRFHTDWLNMIYPRLKVAKSLLAEDGVIFISVDDNEVHNLRKVCDEIFGEQNFIAEIIWEKVHTRKNSAINFSTSHEYILCYAKLRRNSTTDTSGWERNLLPREHTDSYTNPDQDPKGPWKADPITAHNYYSADYTITKPTGEEIRRPQDRYWAYSEASIQRFIEENSIIWGEGNSMPMVKRYLCDVQNGLVPTTLFKREFAGDTSQAKKQIDELFSECRGIFDYTKSVDLMYRLAQISLNPGDIVLDFFSGSATTAHAVMQLNAEDGGHRKFIMVQLPEATDEKSEAYRAGYRNICEIGKERIRRAGAKIAAEAGEKAAGLDLGFRCLRLDTSNMTDVYYAPDAVTQDGLFAQVDNVKADRTPEDLLVQTMLDLGILLSEPITVEEIAGKRVFNVADGFLLACFDRDVTDEAVTAIAKRKPYYAVFRDASMADDSALTNFDQLFAAYSPATVRKVL